MTYDSPDECREDGGLWDETVERCSLDSAPPSGDGGFYFKESRERYSEWITIFGFILLLTGIVLSVTVVGLPLGIPLIFFSLGPLFFHREIPIFAFFSVVILITLTVVTLTNPDLVVSKMGEVWEIVVRTISEIVS